MAALDFLNQDRFFLDLDQGRVFWSYYNPDSVSGGQFVTHIFDRELLEDALETAMDEEDAIGYIENFSQQFCADRGTEEYDAAWIRKSANDFFAEGCNLTTLELIQQAFVASDLHNEYCQREFKMDAEYDDLRKIAIGYTTITDAEHHVQGYANLIDHRIEVYLNGNLAMHRQFESLAEMVQCGLANLEFEDIYCVPDWVVAEHERVAREDSLATRLVLFMKEYDPAYPDILEPGETDADMIRKMKAEFGDVDLIFPTIQEVESVIKSRPLPASERDKLYDIMTDLYHMYTERAGMPVYDRESDILYRTFTVLRLHDYDVHYDSEGICLTRGNQKWCNEEVYRHLASVLSAEDCRKFRDRIFVTYTDFVDLAAHNGIDIRARLQTPPVGRLDFLNSKGVVGDRVEYQTEAAFVNALKEEMHYGVPLVAVLYRNAEGCTISKNFLNDLDTHPKGLVVEDAPLIPRPVGRSERGDAR